MSKRCVPQAILRALFSYHADGSLRHEYGDRKGQAIGGADGKGYLRAMVAARRYGVHQLVWIYHHGELPQAGLYIDHLNGVRADNRIENLRAVRPAVNVQNQRNVVRKTVSGLLGVHLQSGCLNRWRASIKVDGEVVPLGSFGDVNEAHSAYIAAKRRLHEGCTL